MPPRSRSLRNLSKEDVSAPAAPEQTRGRGRPRRAKEETPNDIEQEDDEQDEDAVEETPEPGPSRRARRASAANVKRRASRGSRAAAVEVDEDEDVEMGTPRRRGRKPVSYKEIPAGTDDLGEEEEEEQEQEEDGDDDAEGEEVDAEGEDAEAEEEVKAAKPVLEKVGSGRGGFSVKGAAAAAARARWDKVRRERAERGEDVDDDKPRRRGGGGGGGGARNKKPSDDAPAMGSQVLIKGKEYTVGDDELILPDNEKGDTKIDAEGRLLGGREYKVVTFTSESRRNPNKVYALTIDAARACGYSDSLQFLRRSPQILKLACTPEERQMLIDIGRVTGNLKHRMVTMVAMRNIFKTMGARVVKNGRWVTDDYDEEEATQKCLASGLTPGTIAHEDEILAGAMSNIQGANRPLQGVGDAASRVANLTPFYSIGGPTTHFAGNGAHPFHESGWGNRRSKLRTLGITEEDWMLRTAEDARQVDAQLKEYRRERLLTLQGGDKAAWVYHTEKVADGVKEDADVSEEVKKPSGLSIGVTAKEEDEALTPLPESEAPKTEVETRAATEAPSGPPPGATPGGSIVVETPALAKKNAAKYNWGLGSWQPGVVRAAYEPHTHMPHVPVHTQPTSAARDRLSHYPILSSHSDIAHRNFVQSSVIGPAARGLASVEYVLENSAPGVVPGEERKRMVEEAVSWEQAARKRQRLGVSQTPLPA